MKYRKKPVVIDAVRLTRETQTECYDFIGNSVDFTRATDGEFINIITLEGTMRAQMGDFIIKGINGEFYPCKPGIFEKTYEKVE